MKKILAIDPSGNFTEGKGKTGFVMFWHEDGVEDVFKFGTLSAENYETRVEYWADVAILIAEEKPDVLVVEDYRLYNTAATGAAVQSFSQMETPRLLGVIEQTAVMNQIPVVFQMANTTKPYTDDKLQKLGILKKEKNKWWFKGQAINDHQRSALRHLLRYLDKIEQGVVLKVEL
jgi:hypothetical protein